MFMQNCSKNDVVLVRYPFADSSVSKVRPAVVVSAPHVSEDVFIVPLTSKITNLLAGEFILFNWADAGLNVTTAVKRGIYTVNKSFVLRKVGEFSAFDARNLDDSLRTWLGI